MPAIAARAPRCDVAVAAGGTALAEAVAQAPKGARLCLAAGSHAGGFALDKSLTLIGTPGAVPTVIQGNSRSPALHIDDDGLAIRLQGLTLSGGTSDAGGGLAVYGRGKVTLVDTIFRNNRAGMTGGGGLYARAGLLTVENCRFEANDGRQGGAVFLDQALKAEFKRCTFTGNRGVQAGALRISEAAEATFKACQLHDNAGQDGASVRISATKSRKPTVVFDHCTIDDGLLVNGPEIVGDITIKGSKLPASWKTTPNLQDGGSNTFN